MPKPRLTQNLHASTSQPADAVHRNVVRIEFALRQLAQRIEASDGSELALWRIRQCEAIVEAAVRRAIASMMPAATDRSAPAGEVTGSPEKARAA